MSLRWSSFDEKCMRLALQLAERAESLGEVPVGAVLALSDKVIAEGCNQPISTSDPTSHAEINVLRQAAKHLLNYRLSGATVYVTLEPCVMCVGAMLIARVERLVFAARDLRFGAIRSKFQLGDSDLLNHRIVIEEGLFAAESGEKLARFFQSRRNQAK